MRIKTTERYSAACLLRWLRRADRIARKQGAEGLSKAWMRERVQADHGVAA